MFREGVFVASFEINPDDLPPGLLKAFGFIQRDIDLADAHAEADVNDLSRFLDESSKDDLLVVTKLIKQIIKSQVPIEEGAYFVGLLSGVLHGKFNVCSEHGVNHANEAAEKLLAESANVINDDGEQK